MGEGGRQLVNCAQRAPPLPADQPGQASQPGADAPTAAAACGVARWLLVTLFRLADAEATSIMGVWMIFVEVAMRVSFELV